MLLTRIFYAVVTASCPDDRDNQRDSRDPEIGVPDPRRKFASGGFGLGAQNTKILPDLNLEIQTLRANINMLAFAF